jgi:RNA polymerase sigma-70 factor (ECF subfamily)
MDLKDVLSAGRFLDEISLSVKKIIFANFPGLSEEEKEEIDQDVKLKLLRMAVHGKKIGNLRSYIWKMVYSTALDVIARRSPALCIDEVMESQRPPLRSCVDSLSPEYLFEEKELLAIAGRAIDALPSRRKAAVLCHLQGLSLEETAVTLGESPNAVRHLLYRGLDEIKARISEQSDDLIARRDKKARVARLELKRT